MSRSSKSRPASSGVAHRREVAIADDVVVDVPCRATPSIDVLRFENDPPTGTLRDLRRVATAGIEAQPIEQIGVG